MYECKLQLSESFEFPCTRNNGLASSTIPKVWKGWNPVSLSIRITFRFRIVNNSKVRHLIPVLSFAYEPSLEGYLLLVKTFLNLIFFSKVLHWLIKLFYSLGIQFRAIPRSARKNDSRGIDNCEQGKHSDQCLYNLHYSIPFQLHRTQVHQFSNSKWALTLVWMFYC